MQTGPLPAASRDRSGWIWGLLAMVALWWPAAIHGPLDGAPLDRPLEALLLGLLFPTLWWLHPSFLRKPLAQISIAVLLLIKTASSLLDPAGWCVRFDPPAPIVRESTGRPHSWDVRADWTSPDPECSAVMTHGYEDFKQFPVWFYNLPPVDDSWPTANDRPPYVTLPMSVVGFLGTPRAGMLDIELGPGMALEVVVDGRRADAVDPLHRQIDLDAGTHFVQISGVLTGNRWRLQPRWNGRSFDSLLFPGVTVTEPSTLDLLTHVALRWIALALAAGLMVAWAVATLVSIEGVWALAWAAFATVALAIIGWKGSANIVASPLARWSATALALSVLVPVPERLRNTRGAFLLVGLPWLALVVTGFIDHIGRFSFYTGGEDSWTIQRYAYSIFMQGEWLRGGSNTFYFQPLYRWTSGALHMLFGDSSVGEFWADAAGLIVAALFAYAVTLRIVGHRWGLVAAVTVLTIVMQGPTFGFVGRGLTEISSMGFLYLAMLLTLHRDWSERPAGTSVLGASLSAMLAFCTRLSNLPAALSTAAMALPLDVPVAAVRAPRETVARIRWSVVAGTVAGVSLALLLFALHTWYYAGVFSVTYGTSLGMHRVWQPDLPLSSGFRLMFESFGVLLTMNDPPHVSWYSIPLLAGVACVAALMGVKGVRTLPLALVLFFLGCCSMAFVVRGMAYSGRHSTHLIGAACTIVVLVVAAAFNGISRLAGLRGRID